MTQETTTGTTKPDMFDGESEPMVGLTYWVRCGGYRARAIYTTSGKWLSPHNGKEVERAVSFFS